MFRLPTKDGEIKKTKKPTQDEEIKPALDKEIKPRPCCKAMTAECLACGEGIPIKEFCIKEPKT